MKQRLIILAILFISALNAQTVIPLPGFQAVMNEFPTIEDDTVIIATFLISDFSNQYNGLDLEDREDLVIWRNCQRYPVLEIVELFAAQITVKLNKSGNNNMAPGVCALLAETSSQKISHLISGITDSDKQCIDAYYRKDIGAMPFDSLRLEGDSLVYYYPGDVVRKVYYNWQKPEVTNFNGQITYAIPQKSPYDPNNYSDLTFLDVKNELDTEVINDSTQRIYISHSEGFFGYKRHDSIDIVTGSDFTYNDPDDDPTNELFDSTYVYQTIIDSANQIRADFPVFTYNDPDDDPTNELFDSTYVYQTIIDSAQQIRADFPVFTYNDPDDDPTNELFDSTYVYQTIIDSAQQIRADFPVFTYNDPDDDPTNELFDSTYIYQALIDSALNIRNDFPAFNYDDPDDDPTNELQDVESFQLGGYSLTLDLEGIDPVSANLSGLASPWAIGNDGDIFRNPIMGNVGIQTSNPSYKLTVNDTAFIERLKIGNVDGVANSLVGLKNGEDLVEVPLGPGWTISPTGVLSANYTAGNNISISNNTISTVDRPEFSSIELTPGTSDNLPNNSLYNSLNGNVYIKNNAGELVLLGIAMADENIFLTTPNNKIKLNEKLDIYGLTLRQGYSTDFPNGSIYHSLNDNLFFKNDAGVLEPIGIKMADNNIVLTSPDNQIKLSEKLSIKGMTLSTGTSGDFPNGSIYHSTNGNLYFKNSAGTLLELGKNNSWPLPGTPAGFADNIDNVVDGDANPTNEIQGIESFLLSGTNLSLKLEGTTTHATSLSSLKDTWPVEGTPSGFADNVDNVDDYDWAFGSNGNIFRNPSVGNVGIKTSVPDEDLTVAGVTKTDVLKIGDEYQLPITDGSNGQVPVTDGNGNLSWQYGSGTSYTAGNNISISSNTISTVDRPEFSSIELTPGTSDNLPNNSLYNSVNGNVYIKNNAGELVLLGIAMADENIFLTTPNNKIKLNEKLDIYGLTLRQGYSTDFPNGSIYHSLNDNLFFKNDAGVLEPIGIKMADNNIVLTSPDNQIKLSEKLSIKGMTLSTGTSGDFPNGSIYHSTNGNLYFKNSAGTLLQLGKTYSWPVPGTPAGFTDNVDNVNDADASPTNELQTISENNGTVTLSNGGGSFKKRNYLELYNSTLQTVTTPTTVDWNTVQTTTSYYTFNLSTDEVTLPPGYHTIHFETRIDGDVDATYYVYLSVDGLAVRHYWGKMFSNDLMANITWNYHNTTAKNIKVIVQTQLGSTGSINSVGNGITGQQSRLSISS